MKKNMKGPIIVIAVIASLLLYGAGVLSGLYANKLVKDQTEQTISSLEEYVGVLERNLQSMQLEQSFVETLDHDEMCAFTSVSMNRLVDELRLYWAELPFRIEAYEQYVLPSEEYLSIKKAYTQLSLRTWILAQSAYNDCSTDLIPVLYFYSIDCDTCVEQGQELDKLQQVVLGQGRDILVFTIDVYSDEVRNIASYYNITRTPAVIINNDVYQGNVLADELLEGIV